MMLLPGVAALADDYDGLIIDLWGVIHDGVTPYPGAVACLGALRDRGKRIVLLSNAPRRAAAAIDGLRQLGIDDGLYDAVITSGEMTHQALRDRTDPWVAGLGSRLFHLGPPRDRSVFDDLDLIEADTPAEASFVLNTGPDDLRNPTDPAAYDDILAQCHASGLPMVCANPDLNVVRGGLMIICAGTLAARYAKLGAQVRSIGKPDPAIYAAVLAALRVGSGRVVAVGDSLRTDIAGAAAAGLDAVWILGGIHAHASIEAARADAALNGLDPRAALLRFAW
jgi:HAD superfamily hydrolase (TIGR01459 family)